MSQLERKGKKEKSTGIPSIGSCPVPRALCSSFIQLEMVIMRLNRKVDSYYFLLDRGLRDPGF